MTDFIKKLSIQKPISRGRYASIIVYDDNTAQIAIDGPGTSLCIHFTPEDVEIFFDALHGGSHA